MLRPRIGLVLIAWSSSLLLPISAMLPGQQPNASAPARPINGLPELSPQQRDIVGAIKEIRQQIGGLNLALELPPSARQSNSAGAVSGQLGNVGPSPTDTAIEFERQLRQRVAAHSLPQPLEPQTPAPPNLQLQTSTQLAAHRPTPVSGLSLDAETSALRSAARNLDLAAADLEDAARFKDADQLREQAHEIRLLVRKLVQTGSIAPGKKQIPAGRNP